ncbi:putative TetR family transcriptional regulator [Gordonia effusa NBRC 100432]|uniref:Putative TetR family transcriptional regulator n=1 Tax=Gordonia effusa NBRC 100432 TaxID=1077974 RepID=H0QZI3_9ACTN|nr:TetR/AcrR family transcriptional regulator [Gordonia effusa]GAB18234.1 putative TetR family transcriptional regulator [Gordonia effusa NBRC 100432]
MSDWRTTDPVILTPILAAAKTSFHARGFHGTSTRDIASRAGVSLPTLYYHHENKEGILLAVLISAMESALARVSAAIDDGDDPREQFANGIEAVVLHMTADQELAASEGEIRYVETDNPLRRKYIDMRASLESQLDDVLRRGIADGCFQIDGDVKNMLRYLLGACRSAADWYRPDGPLTPADVAASYVEISLRAVGASLDLLKSLNHQESEKR